MHTCGSRSTWVEFHFGRGRPTAPLRLTTAPEASAVPRPQDTAPRHLSLGALHNIRSKTLSATCGTRDLCLGRKSREASQASPDWAQARQRDKHRRLRRGILRLQRLNNRPIPPVKILTLHLPPTLNCCMH